MKHNRAITLRNVSSELRRTIERRAAREGSLNRAVISLLEECAGAGGRRKKVVHRDLDHLFGRWSRDEADAFEGNLAAQRRIDEELWR